MIVIDTSAWVEYLRRTGSRLNHRLRTLIAEDAELATVDIAVLELLAGTRDETELERVRRLLYATQVLRAVAPEDHERAADIARLCRGAGTPVRGLIDCLIAAVALREDAPILTRDRDFEVISRHTPLRIA